MEQESARDYYAAHVLKRMAQHLSIFEHCLHEHAFFTPVTPLEVSFGDSFTFPLPRVFLSHRLYLLLKQNLIINVINV